MAMPLPKVLREPALVAPGWLPRRGCDLSRGDVQCPATLRLRNADHTESCTFIAGHAGAHKTHGPNGSSWFDPNAPFIERPDLMIPPLAGPPGRPLYQTRSSYAPRQMTRIGQLAGAPEIKVASDGRIEGVDGMLDQVASALMKHAGPMIRSDVLPVVQRDEVMQARVGQAMGNAVADRMMPWVILGTTALGVMALVGVMRWEKQREKTPARRGARRR